MTPQMQISEDLIYLELYKCFLKLLKLLPLFTIRKHLKVHMPYPISSSNACAHDIKRGLMVNHIYNPACSPLHALHFLHYYMLTCTAKFLTVLYNLTLIMLNNISHSITVWKNYFIAFAIVSTYFLFKSVRNRNKTLMKNSSKIVKVFKHGW